MSHYRLRAGHALGVPAVLALTLTVGCGPNQETGAEPAKAAKATATPSPTVTSNGVEKLEPAQILDRARKATASATFLRMRGRIEEGGEQIMLDFRYAGKTKATGSFGVDDQRIEMARLGRTVYVKGNDAFWKSIGGKAAVQLLGGKYLKATAKEAEIKELVAFTKPTRLLTEIVKAEPSWTKGKAGTVGGVPALSLTSLAGDQIHVATQGPPYVLLVDGGPGNRLEYFAYGQPVDVRPPPAGAVVDVDAME